MLTHLLPEIWDEPAVRSRAVRARNSVRLRHRFAYVPFGGGAHGCLGANFASLQVRALLRHLLERFDIGLTEAGSQQWYHWPNCRPVGGLRLTLKAL